MKVNTTKNNLANKLQFESETFQYLVGNNNCYVSSAVWSLQFGSTPKLLSEYLKKLDDICVKIEKTKHNREILLEEKAKGLYSNSYKPDTDYLSLAQKDFGKWGNTTDFFKEVVAFNWLEENSFKNIQFLKKQECPTPDIKAEKNNKYFYIEVKCINMDEESVNYLRSKRSDGMSGEEDYGGLVNKINLILKKADEQFSSVSAKNKILLLSYHWSPKNIGNKKTLKEIFGKEYLNSLGKNNSIQIEEM